ncbi:MAG: hypothetical protein ABI347_04475 [Nitrososphaera sp.]|jgi:hypothetical protein
MPEIWLRYGTTDVVLDIRFENLASQISANFPLMPEEQVKAAFDDIQVTDNMLVLALSPSKAAARAVHAIANSAKAKGFAATVDVPAKFAGALLSGMAALAPDPQAAPIPVNRIDYYYHHHHHHHQQQSLAERTKKFQSTVIVSQVSYDPLFGFAGAPTALVRELMPEKMSEAFAARRDNVPAPGLEGEPLKVATAAAAAVTTEGLQATSSIELVASAAGIAGVHTGTVNEAFAKAVSQLKSMAEVQVEPAKSAIISASGEAAIHSTLSGSLNSLWNSIHAVKEGGTAVLLAENREGIGGGALQSFVEGRLKQEQLALSPYIEGLEHLLYLQEMRQKREVGIISSLPQYYAASKLGMTTYPGVKDALEKLMAKHGKGHKSLVVSDADVVLLKTA